MIASFLNLIFWLLYFHFSTILPQPLSHLRKLWCKSGAHKDKDMWNTFYSYRVIRNNSDDGDFMFRSLVENINVLYYISVFVSIATVQIVNRDLMSFCGLLPLFVYCCVMFFFFFDWVYCCVMCCLMQSLLLNFNHSCHVHVMSNWFNLIESWKIM